jgi:hypothetical protein
LGSGTIIKLAKHPIGVFGVLSDFIEYFLTISWQKSRLVDLQNEECCYHPIDVHTLSRGQNKPVAVPHWKI